MSLAVLRDLAIIVVALVSLVTALAIVFLVVSVWQLARSLRQDVEPILASLLDTTNTVKGTTAFVSDTVVRPTARAAGGVAGAARFLGSLFRIVSRIKQR